MNKLTWWLKSIILLLNAMSISNINTLNASDKAELLDYNQKVATFVNKLSQLEKTGVNENNLERVLNKATLQLDCLDIDYNVNAIHKIIDRILRDKIAFPVTVQVLIKKDHIATFYDAFSNVTDLYPAPHLLNWRSSCRSSEVINNMYDAELYRTLQLTLFSNEKRRDQIKNDFCYQINNKDRTKLDFVNIYSLVQRSGFALKDFKYDSLRVRLLDVKSVTLQSCIDEIDSFIKLKRSKDHNPFHIFAIVFNPQHPLKSNEVFLEFHQQKYFDYYGTGMDRGMITDPDNNCFYLCIDNHARQHLDLHGQKVKGVHNGKPVKYAKTETLQFIQQAYHHFDDQVTVLTGRGNHVNANGQKGVLKSVFKTDWIKDPAIAPWIKKCLPIEGQGGYQVNFIKAKKITVSMGNVYNLLFKLKPTIDDMLTQGNKRLVLTSSLKQDNLPNGIKTSDLVFNLTAHLPKQLTAAEKAFYESISPLSVEETSQELRVILNTRHHRYPDSTSWGSAFDQNKFSGTLDFRP